MIRWNLLLSLVVACLACRGGDVGAPGGSRFVPPAEVAGVALTTQVSATRTAAGAPLLARCLARQNGAFTDAVATQVTIEPDAPVARRTSVETVFVPTRAGNYVLRCVAEGSVDRQGVGVQVDPGPAARVGLELGTTEIVAGQATPARCVAVDGLGNPTALDHVELQLDDGLVVRDDRVTARRADTYSLGCVSDAVPVDAPARLRVVPADAERVVTRLAARPAVAGEPVDVTCLVEDAFANPVAAQTTFEVTERGGGPAAGLVTSAAAFVAAVATDYTVRCTGHGLHDAAGVAVRVEPALPFAWSAAAPASPDGRCFWQNHPLAPRYEAWDRFGNVVQAAHLTMRATPAHGVTTAVNGALVFAEAGDYEVEAELSPRAPNARIEPLRWHMRVDSTPPVVDIISPRRAEAVEGGDYGTSAQEVVGTVSDPSGLHEVKIDGRPVDFVPGATEVHFRVQRPSVWGLSVIDAQAIDACGMAATISQSYLRSPRFAPPARAPQAQARVDAGLMARLSQPLFDDGHRGAAPDDVASVLEAALASDHLNDMLPYYLRAWPHADADGALPEASVFGRTGKINGWEVTRDGPLQMAAPKVEYLRAYDGGWRLALLLGDMHLPVRLHTYTNWLLATRHNSVAATLDAKQLRIALDVRVTEGEDGARLELCPTCVEMHFATGDPTLNVEWEEVGALGMEQAMRQLTANVFDQLFRGRVGDALQQQLREDVLASMQQFVGTLRLGQALDLPAPLKGGVAVESRVDHLRFAGPEGEGYGELGLSAQLYPSGDRGRVAGERGPILARPTAMSMDLSGDESFAVAIKDDLVNQFLWSLWASGAFEMPALDEVLRHLQPAEQTFPDGVHLSLRADLPPVVMPSDSPTHVSIGLGDAYVEGDIDVGQLYGQAPTPGRVLHFGLYASVIVEAEVQIDAEQRLRVVPRSTTGVHTQVVDISDPGLQPMATEMVSHWLNVGLPQVISTALAALPLPALDMGSIPGVAPGTSWRVQNGTLQRAPGANHTTLKGRLESVLP